MIGANRIPHQARTSATDNLIRRTAGSESEGRFERIRKLDKSEGWKERERGAETHVCWTDSNAASLRDLTLSLKKISKIQHSNSCFFC